MTTPALGNIEALRPKRKGGRPAKLSGEQAREIFRAVGTAGLSQGRALQLAGQFGVNFATIYDIAKGRTYAWATADLRPTPTPKAAPKAAPKAEAAQDVTARTEDERAALEAERQRIKADYQRREAERAAQAAKPDLSTFRNLQGDPSTRSALIADLADAVELLLDIRDGKPLPRFVALDTEAIRRLVELARQADAS